MNPDRIYQQHRDDALADQVEATLYSTFVAMPLKDRYSYKSQDIFKNVICHAAEHANELNRTKRQFAVPQRADSMPGVAASITEDIIQSIMKSHLFLADHTSSNPGVLLETGLALGLKSTQQIILIVQGPHEDLHFDVQDNRFISYDSDDAVEIIANALINAASHFETTVSRYVSAVAATLSPRSLLYLKQYATACNWNPEHDYSLQPLITSYSANYSQSEYLTVIHQLYQKRLIYTSILSEYDICPYVRVREHGNLVPSPEEYVKINKTCIRATKLGWAAIHSLWPEDQRA